MKILDYLTPENPIAQLIIYLLLALFLIWCALLVLSLVRHLLYWSQINRCRDVGGLRAQQTTLEDEQPESVLHSQQAGAEIFQAFQQDKRLQENGPITRHLSAIFEAGWNESQLDARGLVKITTDELFRVNSLHRPLLSIFIILGLLGTLFGLADTLASLDTLLHGNSSLNNDILGQSLQRLLGTLESAFAPSIWGVSLTVLGVLIFAFYMRVIALPLSGLLERMTLTVWIPQLVPTASQKLLDKLQLSEHQMQRSFEAAQEVAEFAESIKEKTGDLGKTLGLATKKLKVMTKVSDNLETFSETFVEGVKVLAPFQQDLRILYQQMTEESRAFQESVKSNIAGSQDFQKQIQNQLNSQHSQLAQVLNSLQSYEAAYVTNRERIDEKLGAVLVQAEKAFESLGQRNEEIGAALDESLGKPLRENLAVNLGAVRSELQGRLAEIKNTLEVTLSSMGDRLGRLDDPLNKAAQNFTDTFSNFNETTRGWLEKLQREFANQNETNQQQLEQLKTLGKQIPDLLQTLSESSRNFSETSGSFAAHGKQLSADVTALSQNISTLGTSIGSLSEQVSLGKPSTRTNAEERLVELIGQQTGVLKQLGAKIQSLTAAQPRRREPAVVSDDGLRQEQFQPRLRWRDRFKRLFRGRG